MSAMRGPQPLEHPPANRRAPGAGTVQALRLGHRGGSSAGAVQGHHCACSCTTANPHPAGFTWFNQHPDLAVRRQHARSAGVPEGEIDAVTTGGTHRWAAWHYC